MTTKIQFFGDPSCPWCYLGAKRFEMARAEFAPDVLEMSIEPFFINPDIPVNGMGFDQYLMARYGDQKAIAAALLPLQKGCEEDGIELALEKIKLMPNTMNPQALLHIAHGMQTDWEVFKALQNAFFVNGLDISNRAVLREIAEAHNIDGAAFLHILDTGDNTAIMNSRIQEMSPFSIREVPAWVIGGSYIVNGVQSASFWRNVIGEIDEKGRELARKQTN